MVYKVVYKTISAILAICIIPIAIFSPMIQIVGDVSIMKTYVGEELSLYEIYNLFFGKDVLFEGFGAKMTDQVRATMPNLITSGCFLGVALLLAIATAVVAICCKKKLPTLIVAAVGCLAVIGLFVSFKHFAAPYLDGTIDISGLGLMEEGILETIASAMVKLQIFQISSAGFLMFGGFLCVCLWTAAFMLVEIGEDPKKARK